MPRLFVHYTGTAIRLNNGGTVADAEPLVSSSTRDHERDPRQAAVRASSWRALVKHRITVCCDYGEAHQRPAAIY